MVNTQTKNTSTHPSLRHDPLPQWKCWTLAEVAVAKEEKAAAQAAKEKEKQQVVTHIVIMATSNLMLYQS